MATIDKAAIAWTIAIVAFGAGIAVVGGGIQDSTTPVYTTPTMDRDMMDKDTMMMDKDSMMDKGPQTIEVSIPVDSGYLGCEETDECYLPSSVTVNTGDTIVWINDDSLPHTVTSGDATNGPDDIFDSSLLSAGADFEFTFDDSGRYDYYCIVHPWMSGSVRVK